MFWEVLFYLIEGIFYSIQYQEFVQLSNSCKHYFFESTIPNTQFTSS